MINKIDVFAGKDTVQYQIIINDQRCSSNIWDMVPAVR